MKKVLALLIVASGLLMASQDGNKVMCDALKKSMPKIYFVGLDYLNIMSGEESTCESYSKEEWKNLMTTEYYGRMAKLSYKDPNLYQKVVAIAQWYEVKDAKGFDQAVDDKILALQQMELIFGNIEQRRF